ncbi:MAG: hypothetical protein NXI24_22810 [bacterium]|nr:hypothetical protein [bacterium]
MKQHQIKYGALRRLAVVGATLLFAATAIYAHDEGHATPEQLPPIGPHGGKYAQLERHFAEVVVQGGTLTLYILEPDVKHVAEDATGVTAAYQVPGKLARRELKLSKSGTGYRAQISIPAGARRVVFFVSCVLDGQRESGRVLYEPRR